MAERVRPEMNGITHLFAGVPVSDLDASIDWYTRFFGRSPDSRVGAEVLWEVDEHAWLFIEPNAARAGAGRITLAVSGLDALLERLSAQGIEHEPIEIYSNGVVFGDWTTDRVRPWSRAATDTFRPERCTLGSDMPIDRLRSGFGRLYDAPPGNFLRSNRSRSRALFGATAPHW